MTTITLPRATVEQALEALVSENSLSAVAMQQRMDAIRALHAALAQQAEPVEPVAFDDGMPTSAEERHSRRLLAVRVGMPHTYYDDGEAQGTEHGIIIDFMREPVAHIDAKLRALNVARAIAKQAEPVAVDVDALAQHIRFVDGNNNLGAGTLAEKIVEFLIKLGIGKEQAEPVEPVEPVAEPFVVRHYICDDRPTIKGNGFDGLVVGDNREEADQFVAWVNARIAAPPQRAPLTKEEIEFCRQQGYAHGGLSAPFDFGKAARAVERAHGIKE